MKTLLFTIIMLTFNVTTIAQIIDCDILTNIDGLTNKSILENSYSNEKIIVNKDLIKGMIVSAKEIKLTNGSYGNGICDAYVLASVSTCDTHLKSNELYVNESFENIEQKISILPNPSRDFITINWLNHSVSLVSLVTIDGKVLETKVTKNLLNEVKFDLSGLSSGMYQILILENEKSKIYKIIKQ